MSEDIKFETGKVLVGSCLDRLKELPDGSIDSIVTDPPYELGFMGKKWDASGVAYNVELWAECLRVLKPGGHLLAFGGTRTYHRMAVAIEDAGFEIRDSIHWVYGSGFPKSLDVSKAIDKQLGAERKVVGTRISGGMGQGRTDSVLPPSNIVGGANNQFKSGQASIDITAPATAEAKQWAGWGTALKPAHEPIVLARKPLDGTVAQNVIWYGTGALNIDGCRVEGDRWPANIIFDEAAGAELGDTARFFYCPKPGKKERNAGLDALPVKRPDTRTETGMGTFDEKGVQPQRNFHPTVKPVALMRYLVRLVTPPNGTVLDPFLGSGTTAVAAIAEGFAWVGCEMTVDYLPIISGRVKHAEKPPKKTTKKGKKSQQLSLENL